MGTNPLVQYLLQPVLFLGVIFHLLMGIKLELQNKAARPVKYAFNNASANSSWMSRNMIITGIMILLFLTLHLIDFFFPTINAHYITNEHLDSYEMVIAKFSNVAFVAVYVVAFVFLSLHLLHGFQSAFQSVGFRHNRYTPVIKKLGNLYAVIIPLGYAIIALYHYANSL
ncbi:MAG: succinate dehydrogenase cytochrome b subunit [Vicingaceae bacterium]